jgi:hypothetical protein
MIGEPRVQSPAQPEIGDRKPASAERVWQEGIAAGLLGAAVIAVFFLVIDAVQGRPFYTPSLLGAALFRRDLLAGGTDLPISFDRVLHYSWVHGLVFCLVGGLASRLFSLAEERPNVGFGIFLFFVVFEFGFVGLALAFAAPILHALSWPAVLVGNLLAATAMALYLWRRHPGLTILP